MLISVFNGLLLRILLELTKLQICYVKFNLQHICKNFSWVFFFSSFFYETYYLASVSFVSVDFNLFIHFYLCRAPGLSFGFGTVIRVS